MKGKRKEKQGMEKQKKKIWPIICKILHLLLFVSCIAVPIIIHHFSEKFNIVWCICTIVFLMIPYAATGLKILLKKPIKFNDEQKKYNKKRIRHIMYYFWFMDFVALCIFQRWLIMSLIFGVLALIIIFYNIAIIFSSKKNNNRTIDYGIICDLILGIALTVFLIYIIPNEDLRNIVIPIIAAVYGGLLTLVGVSLTIKKTEANRKEEEIKKAKPIFAYNMLKQEPKFDGAIGKICMSDTLESFDSSCDVYVELENSNLSSFELKRVYHDGNWVNLEGNTIVLPSAKCILNFRFADKSICIFLEVEDVLSNKYYYQLFVLFLNAQSSNGMALYSIREIKSISKDDMEKAMKEECKNA